MKRSQPLYFITATLFLLLSFTTNVQATSGETNIKTFTLQLWAADEVPPSDAKHVEIGGGYYYRYTPEAVSFTDNTNRKVHITFDNTLASRYQFRWVTATIPGDVTLEEKLTRL